MFGPEEIVDHLSEFLGEFMIRKVVAGRELLQAAGTVTKALVLWLRDEGWIDDDALAIASDRGSQAERDLPRAEELSCLLYDVIRHPDVLADDPRALPTGDRMDGSLRIERVEPGALWFEGGIGPLDVPSQVSELAQVGWHVTVLLARVRGVWHLVELGNVYPDVLAPAPATRPWARRPRGDPERRRLSGLCPRDADLRLGRRSATRSQLARPQLDGR